MAAAGETAAASGALSACTHLFRWWPIAATSRGAASSGCAGRVPASKRKKGSHFLLPASLLPCARVYHHQLLADELQAAAVESANDPHARSCTHHRNVIRTIYRARAHAPVETRCRRGGTGRREVSKVTLLDLQAAPLHRHRGLFLPLRTGAGRVTASTKSPNGESSCIYVYVLSPLSSARARAHSRPSSLFLSLFKGRRDA